MGRGKTEGRGEPGTAVRLGPCQRPGATASVPSLPLSPSSPPHHQTYSIAVDARIGVVLFPAGDALHVIRLHDGAPAMPPMALRFPHSVVVDEVCGGGGGRRVDNIEEATTALPPPSRPQASSLAYVSCLSRSGCNAVLVCGWQQGGGGSGPPRLVPLRWLASTENRAAVATARWLHLALVPPSARLPVPLLLVASQVRPWPG